MDRRYLNSTANSLTCPNYQNKFTTSALASANTVFGLTTDLHRLAGGAEPLNFLIHSCQNCGFTGGKSEFQGSIEDRVATKIKQFIYPHIRDEQLDAYSIWEFAAQISEWRQQSPGMIAQLCLNAKRD